MICSDCRQGAKERAWKEEEVEWQRGLVKWEVEIEALQICLQAEVAGGRFLLAAQRAGLAGRHLEAANLNAIHLDVDQASCSHTIIHQEFTCPHVGHRSKERVVLWTHYVSASRILSEVTAADWLLAVALGLALQVQAYVEHTTVNPGSVASWLEYEDGKLRQQRLSAADPLR